MARYQQNLKAICCVAALAVSACGTKYDPFHKKKKGDATDESTTDEYSSIASSGSTGGTTTGRTILQLIGQLRGGCSARIWKGYPESWATYAVVTDSADWMLNQDGSIAALTDNQKALIPATASSWQSVNFGGQIPTVVFNYPPKSPINNSSAGVQSLRLALHEGFHVFQQGREIQNGGWPTKTAGVVESSMQLYPDIAASRYYRLEVIHNLLAAYKDPSNAAASLAKAKYWQDKFNTESPWDAAQSQVGDQIEGTAYYSEVVGMTLAQFGCGQSEEALRQHVLGLIGSGEVLHNSFDRAVQPYDAGMLAALILRSSGQSGWMDQVESGTSPLEVLLASVQSTPTDEDATLRAQADDVVNANQIGLDAVLKAPFQALQDPKALKLAVSLKRWNFGSLGYGANSMGVQLNLDAVGVDNITKVHLNPQGIVFIHSDLTGSFPRGARYYDGTQMMGVADDIQVHDVAAFTSDGDMNCGDLGVAYTLLPLAGMTASDLVPTVIDNYDVHTLTLKNDNITFNGEVFPHDDGVLCAGERKPPWD